MAEERPDPLGDYFRQWGLKMYIAPFKEQATDLETLQMLSESDIKELMPVIGHKAKLNTQINMLKSITSGEAANNSMEICEDARCPEQCGGTVTTFIVQQPVEVLIIEDLYTENNMTSDTTCRGWVCQYAGFAPIAQAIFFAGSFVGGLLFGWLADRFGRVPALVGANLIGCVGGVLSIFSKSLWDFAVCRFLVGMSYDSCFILMYILVLEYVGPSHRTWIANMSIALYFGGGCLILPWLAVWISDWKILLLSTSLPMLIAIGVPFVVPESARWLSSQGKVNQAVAVLRKFERVNRTKIPEDVMDEFIVSSRQTRQTDESIGALLKSSQLRLMMVFMVIVYMACAVVFDGLVRMSENLGYDFFITFTLTSATEIPSVTLLAFVLDKWGRRKLTVGPLWIAGTLSVMAAFVPKGIPQVALAIMARFCINMAYNTIIQWATELLPTPVRASGSSVVHVSGYVGTVLSPFIVYSEHTWRSLPLLILGITGLFAGGIAMLLPESMGRALPQNIVEGERLFNEYSWCGKPEDETKEEWKNDKEKALIT